MEIIHFINLFWNCNVYEKLSILSNKNEKKYSYSYNDFLRIKRYSKNLPTSSKWKTTGISNTYGYGGNCDTGACNPNIPKVIWKGILFLIVCVAIYYGWKRNKDDV